MPSLHSALAQARPHALRFERFQLLPSQRRLVDGGQPVVLGSRALDLLMLLLERAGELVSNDEIVTRVWPGGFVGEGSLRVQMTQLRRALGDTGRASRHIVNDPGRGYRFVTPVHAVPAVPMEAGLPVEAAPATVGRRSALRPLTAVFGREAASAQVTTLLSRQRVVSLVGCGGIGKTTLARMVAAAIDESGCAELRFVDLSTSPLDIETLVGPVSGEPTLLVLDNCEHRVHEAAHWVDHATRRHPRLRILATSREALRMQGEWVVRVAPLEVPDALAGLTAATVQRFSAVQLLLERAAAAGAALTPDGGRAPDLAAIVSLLDGLPLAIELAAARLSTWSPRELLQRLQAGIGVLGHGWRTAPARHRTLHGVIAWSYEMLTPPEQQALRRLARLRHDFTLAEGLELPDLVHALVEKSLLSVVIQDGHARYRMLHITRQFLQGLAAAAPAPCH